MDFFSKQEDRRMQSVLLLGCFVAAMLSSGLIIHIASIVFFGSGGEGFLSYFIPSKIALLFIVLLWTSAAVGCYFRYTDVRGGGGALAVRFGAVKAQVGGRNQEETELVDIVSEMAIASHCAMPEVYVLPGERTINAFVVGGFDGNEAIVVSHGALYNLDREKLKAIVAHEFGHISQGDIPINMRLLVALGGLNAIDEVGRLLMVRLDGEYVVQPGLFVGALVRVIGSIGVLSGRVIRGAFSRQREFLADACAVQFTRNPASVSGVLATIRDEIGNDKMHCIHAEEVAHLCFQVAPKEPWYEKYFATHPPIQDRIDSIDPNFALKERVRERTEQKQSQKPSMYTDGSGATVVPFGEPAIAVNPLSDPASVLLLNPVSSMAILHALFVCDDKAKAQHSFQTIAKSYNAKFAIQVGKIHKGIHDDLNSHQIELVEKSAEILRRTLSPEHRKNLLKSLERILIVDGEFSLKNYITYKLISRKLDTEETSVNSAEEKVDTKVDTKDIKSFQILGSDFALLLSLIVEASGNKKANLDEQFKRALKCYTQDEHARRYASDPGIVNDMEASFKILYKQSQTVREAFVRHCLEIAQSDGHIAEDEKALLNLFAASLNCESLAA